MKGVTHYKKNGTIHKGATHKMPDGTLHSNKTHTASSKKLFHLSQLNTKIRKKIKANLKNA